MKLKLFYTWLLPALWLPVTIVSFYNTGDEHACFAIGTFPFSWPIAYIFRFNNLSFYLLTTLPFAIIVLALSGLAMDALRANRIIVSLIFAICFALLFWFFVKDFESLQAIRSKHRTILAPLCAALNVSLYFTIVFSVIGTVVYRIIKSLSNKSNVGINPCQQA